MSAIAPNADIAKRDRRVSFVPQTTRDYLAKRSSKHEVIWCYGSTR
jgi:hypothetical protein